jgi:hypothetical protein
LIDLASSVANLRLFNYYRCDKVLGDYNAMYNEINVCFETVLCCLSMVSAGWGLSFFSKKTE